MSRFFSKRAPLIKEFFSRSFGVIGVALLLFFIIMSISAPIVAPNAASNWSNLDAWRDNPRAVPPVWYLQLINAPLFPTTTISASNYNESELSSNLYSSTVVIEFKNENTGLPTGFVFYITYEFSSNLYTLMNITRPDGKSIILNLNSAITFPIPSNSTIFEARVTSDSSSLRNDFYNWLKDNKIDLYSIASPSNLVISHLIFSKLNQKILSPKTAEPLKGEYKFQVYAISGKPVRIKVFKLIIQGNAYGIMGTDGLKRDEWAGLIWGAPIALLLGISTSLISLIIGLVYGTVSGYYGKRIDEIMMRIVDVLISIPVLPILILFLVYFGRTASIWILIFLISIFGWMGIARVARSSTLQIKELPFIESTRVMGAGNIWIMFKHIIPQMMPYAYANLALGVPAAILTEAGLSFLGLGDPTLPTWGQLLNHAQDVAAVQFGYWWLWIPPGLLIAGISIAFVFIGHALDEVLNPRIRRL